MSGMPGSTFLGCRTAVVAFAVFLFTSGASAATSKIRVMVYNGAYTSLTAHVAQDVGFYQKNGLDAELVTVASGPAGVAAMLGGSIDFAEPPADQVILNVLKGTDVKIVVGNEVRNFYSLIAANKKSLPNAAKGYPDVVRDFKGKTIGVNALGATTHLMMNAMLKDVGLSPTDVTYLAVGSSATALAAWQSGRVDIEVAFTPFPEIVKQLGIGEAVLDLSKGEGPETLQKLGGAFEGFVATGAFIAANKATVDNFIKSHVEAIAWMKDPANRGKLVDLIQKYVAVSIIPEDSRAATIDRMIDAYSGYLGSTVDPAAIPAWNKYLADSGLATRAVTPEEVIYVDAPKP
jgi:NitT/TauT family transport system substrate-binding protein